MQTIQSRTVPPHPGLGGLWLPLVTPFRDGALDEVSLRRLLRHYAASPIDGLVLAATTGEGLTLDAGELERLVAIAAEELARRPDGPGGAMPGGAMPVFLGLSGTDTRGMVQRLQRSAAWAIDGYLIACPYYTRPSQAGMLRHFSVLADSAAHPIMIYNIPYRTGVNLDNDAMLELAGHRNIVGLKDCSANIAQSIDLIRRKPPGFAVLTGEDALYHLMLTQGAEGGIIASAHVATGAFAAIPGLLAQGDNAGALAAWRDLAELPRLFFAEPSPSPIKHWLWRAGLIDSAEVRLPMMPVSDSLAAAIEREMARTRL